MKNSINKQSGFTIIELVVVMVVIGILSAVALPRLFDLGKQARKSLAISVSSSLKTAVELGYAQWTAAGQPPSITVGNDPFYMGTLGYPINTGSSSKTVDAAECIELWNKLLKNPPLASVTSGCATDATCKFEVTFATNTCTFTDKDSNTITYDTSTGAVETSVATLLY